MNYEKDMQTCAGNRDKSFRIEVNKEYFNNGGDRIKIVDKKENNNLTVFYDQRGEKYNRFGTHNLSPIMDLYRLVEPINDHNPLDDMPTVKEQYPNLEAVQHPSHYGGKDDPYETIKVMKAKLTPEEFIGAMKFNVAKYNDRAKKKGDELENYEKALFYQIELVNFLRERRTDPA